MNLNRRRAACLIIGVAFCMVLAPGSARRGTHSESSPMWPAGAHSDPKTTARPANLYGRLPMSFEANVGQVGGGTIGADPGVKFLSRGTGYTLFLTTDQAVLALRQKTSGSAALRMGLVGANPAARVKGEQELPGKTNYFIGRDPSRWRRNVPNYARVRYQDVYRGVDLVYYGREQNLEYDFEVAPGADPAVIRLRIGDGAAGTDRRIRLHVNHQGDLLIPTGGGEVRLRKPVVYQPVPAVAAMSSSP